MRAGLEMWLVKKKHTHTTARERRWSKSPKKKRVDLYHSLGFMFMAVFHFSQRVCGTHGLTHGLDRSCSRLRYEWELTTNTHTHTHTRAQLQCMAHTA